MLGDGVAEVGQGVGLALAVSSDGGTCGSEQVGEVPPGATQQFRQPVDLREQRGDVGDGGPDGDRRGAGSAGSAAKSIEYATGDRRFVMSLSLVAVFAVAHRKITRGITAVLSDGWAAADDAGRGLAVEHRTRTVRVILDAAMAVGRSAAQQRRAGDRRRRAQSSTQP